MIDLVLANCTLLRELIIRGCARLIFKSILEHINQPLEWLAPLLGLRQIQTATRRTVGLWECWLAPWERLAHLLGRRVDLEIVGLPTGELLTLEGSLGQS